MVSDNWLLKSKHSTHQKWLVVFDSSNLRSRALNFEPTLLLKSEEQFLF
jgi:hypothetical protein